MVMEMECVEAAAFKSCFGRELVVGEAAGLLPFPEEFCGGVVVGAPCEDFLVDELFDFPNEEDVVGGIEEEEELREREDGFKGEGAAVVPCGSGNSDGKGELPTVQDGELGVPADDLADLEWLSHFVEDSSSGFSLPFPGAAFLGKTNSPAKGVGGAKAGVPGQENRVFVTPVHARARRSRRPRTGRKGWLLGSPSLSETSSSSSSSSWSSNCITSDAAALPNLELAEPPMKKQRKWGSHGSGPPGEGAARKCSHCGVQKTPQWRAGPMGPKTLCNACGVRFKSGRLFPEYRPACSPTFSRELHSNHHRKVLEMRRKKEPSPELRQPVRGAEFS
ncbi:hypothetical protein MLD38_029593 [Melastoma candidum]|uniref:Uncharacterized protein n=1 Tax=Melastoma candidum TaxID=119954 RepID=A0ACB9N4M2_9MYRT|nr:hypothetical protein MLD38_029593 [Melastoma candidum]